MLELCIQILDTDLVFQLKLNIVYKLVHCIQSLQRDFHSLVNILKLAIIHGQSLVLGIIMYLYFFNCREKLQIFVFRAQPGIVNFALLLDFAQFLPEVRLCLFQACYPLLVGLSCIDSGIQLDYFQVKFILLDFQVGLKFGNGLL